MGRGAGGEVLALASLLVWKGALEKGCLLAEKTPAGA